MNVQIIAGAAGRLMWASAALPGAVKDLTGARTHAIIDALTTAEVMTLADKAHEGVDGSLQTPFKRRRHDHAVDYPAPRRGTGSRPMS
jgi:hypothetical protein